jgi:uncharacterized membrane protein YeaQ/YmgE (transglycosylase-associated protein family)
VLASLVVHGGGLGFNRDVIVGLVGAVIGGLILQAVTNGAHRSVKVWREIVVAFVVAFVLLLIIKVIDPGRGPVKDPPFRPAAPWLDDRSAGRASPRRMSAFGPVARTARPLLRRPRSAILGGGGSPGGW